MRRAHHSAPRRRRSALTRLAVIACAVVVFGTIARATKQTRADAAALKRLDELDPHGFLREQWEFKPKGAGDGNRDDATRSSDAAVLSPHCEASLAAHLPLDEFSLSKTPHDTVARSRLYSAFARSVRRDGLTLFDPENAATQGLAQGSLFRKETSTHGGVFVPILTRLDTPVRAIVVPLPAASNAANTIYANTKRVLEKYFPSEKGGVYDFSTENHARSVWLQDPTLYHFSTFHASHHLAPIPLGGDEGEADVAREVELNAVRAVARQSCPIDAVIERVVVTPSGVVMALWNIEAGVEPRVFRDDLARALPNAPAKQIVKEKVIWHSTVARVLAPPNGDASTAEGNAAAATNTQRALTEALCGVKASLPVAWFVEEFDVLALALGGRFDKHDVPFQCQ